MQLHGGGSGPIGASMLRSGWLRQHAATCRGMALAAAMVVLTP